MNRHTCVYDVRLDVHIPSATMYMYYRFKALHACFMLVCPIPEQRIMWSWIYWLILPQSSEKSASVKQKVSYSHICTLVHSPYLYYIIDIPFYQYNSGFILLRLLIGQPSYMQGQYKGTAFFSIFDSLLLPSLPVFSSSLHLYKSIDNTITHSWTIYDRLQQ